MRGDVANLSCSADVVVERREREVAGSQEAISDIIVAIRVDCHLLLNGEVSSKNPLFEQGRQDCGCSNQTAPKNGHHMQQGWRSFALPLDRN
jgi:hypothetical protein